MNKRKRSVLLTLVFTISLLSGYRPAGGASVTSGELKMFDNDEDTFAQGNQAKWTVTLRFEQPDVYGLNIVFSGSNIPKSAEITDEKGNLIYKNGNFDTLMTKTVTPRGSEARKAVVTFEPSNVQDYSITFGSFTAENPVIREIEPLIVSQPDRFNANPVPEALYPPLVKYELDGKWRGHALYQDMKYVSLTGLMEITAPDEACNPAVFKAAADRLDIVGKEKYTSLFNSGTTQAQAAQLLHNIALLKKKGPTLMLLLDEGIGNGSIHQIYKNDLPALYDVVNRMYEELLPLTVKYNVAVLFYPHLDYDRNQEKPIDRIDPALKQTLRFFEEKKDMKVYLEMFSSGIGLLGPSGGYTTQVMAPLYDNPGEKGRKALAMDVNTLAALKQAYPNALEGIRFHEMFGGVNRNINAPDDVKARPFEPDLFKAVIDTCAENNLKLDWGDSSWFIAQPAGPGDTYPSYVYNTFGSDHKPYYENEPYSSMFDYAEEKLGENVCFNWNNNNWHFTANFGFFTSKIGLSSKDVTVPVKGSYRFDLPYADLPFKNRKKSGWGISNQSWFWYENIRNTLGVYYRYGEYIQPVEVMTAFTKKGIAEGAHTVQYEPVQYFFNIENPSWLHANPGKTNPLVYEKQPDGSAKMTLKRHIQQLLNADNPNGPPADIGRIFDRNQQRFAENDISDPPLDYTQTTLGIAGYDYGVYDFYGYGGRWLRQDDYRFDDAVYASDKVIRLDIQGDGFDEIAAVNYAEGGAELTLYSSFGSCMGTYRIEGDIVDITSANLCDDVVGEGDNDELVAAVRENGGVRFDVYEITQISSLLDSITLTKLSAAEAAKVLAVPVYDGEIVGITGVRHENILYQSKVRNLDTVAVLTTKGLYCGKSFVPAGGVKLAAADINNDRRDELLLLDGNMITAYQIFQNQILPVEKQRIVHKNVRFMFSQRRSMPVFAKGKTVEELWMKGKELNGVSARANMNAVPAGTNNAGKAFDGSFDTWAQSAADTPWDLTLDLGQPTAMHKVKLDLGTKFYAKKFELQVSDDGTEWKTVAAENDGKGQTKIYTFPETSCVNFRLNVIETNGGGGHSVREITFLDD